MGALLPRRPQGRTPARLSLMAWPLPAQTGWPGPRGQTPGQLWWLVGFTPPASHLLCALRQGWGGPAVLQGACLLLSAGPAPSGGAGETSLEGGVNIPSPLCSHEIVMQLSLGAGALQTNTSSPGICHHPTWAHGPGPLSASGVGILASAPLLGGRFQRAGRGSVWALGRCWCCWRGTLWSLGLVWEGPARDD